MSLLLPPADSELRDMFEVERLARREWCTYREALASAKRTFEQAERGAVVVGVQFVAIRADDEVQLISVGPRGGVKVLWRFGKPYGLN